MLKDVELLRKSCDAKIKKDHKIPYKELNDLCEFNALEMFNEGAGEYRDKLFEQSLFVKLMCIEAVKQKAEVKWQELYFKALLSETPFLFESYIEYLEHNRPNEKKFYQPRKQVLHRVALDLQWLEDDPNAKFYGLSLPARTGKSTLAIMFLTWIMLKRPDSNSAMCGHSGILAKGFYKEVLNFISTEEYAYADMWQYLHPEYKTMIRDKSADEFTINLGGSSRFSTLTCRGIDGTWTGAVNVSDGGLLYVDDLVRDREHSLSPIRMENTYQEYLNKCVDRMNVGSKQLMIGTLWNIYDPLERLRQQYDGQEGYRFTRIPALNENDESNFQYTINGFTTEYYREMREKLNDAEWQAKYQQRPYVREGLLFQSDDLRYFNGILPEGDHRIVSVCDVAWGGGDSLSMPIGTEYENGDTYIFAWVYNKGTKEVTLPLVTGQIINNQIRQICFEGNTGGDLYSQYVNESLRDNGYKCSCTSKKAPSTMAKQEKIIAYSDDIKRKFIFLTDKRPTPEERQADEENGITRYVRNDEYQNAMNDLCIFTTLGKNEHDDAPDALTQLAMFQEGGVVAKVEAVRNPFRGMYDR